MQLACISGFECAYGGPHGYVLSHVPIASSEKSRSDAKTSLGARLIPSLPRLERVVDGITITDLTLLIAALTRLETAYFSEFVVI